MRSTARGTQTGESYQAVKVKVHAERLSRQGVSNLNDNVSSDFSSFVINSKETMSRY